MKTIKDIHAAFASACFLVSQLEKTGAVQKSRASVNSTNMKLTTVTLADTSKLAPACLDKAKAAVKLYNAGHEFQTQYKANLAELNETHACLVPAESPEAPASEPLTTEAQPAQAPEAPAETEAPTARKRKAA